MRERARGMSRGRAENKIELRMKGRVKHEREVSWV